MNRRLAVLRGQVARIGAAVSAAALLPAVRSLKMRTLSTPLWRLSPPR
jgi:hypothetical protein